MSEVKIAVIGLGYVGLPLSLQFARSGVSVIGLEIDQSKVDAINAGESFIKHIESADINEQVNLGKFSASVDYSRVQEVDAVLICVPTPLNKNRNPDISFVLETGKAIGSHLKRRTLVVLESTTYPGTTDTDLRKVLEDASGMKAGEDFYLAYSPEREDPGNPNSIVAKIPKVIGGFTENCRIIAEKLYSIAVEKTVPVSSCRTAEATKLMENIFRSVNIALVNELKQVFAAMDIDIWEVIESAKTKPFGFMPFYPGPGLGGHCIPIDPFYLTWKAREYGRSTKFIELAGEVNISMPDYVVSQTAFALNKNSKAIKGSKILIMGLAYKKNVDDDRESASFMLMEKLKEQEAIIDYYDPYIPVIGNKRDYKEWSGKKSINWSREIIEKYDVILISTAHDIVNYQQLCDWGKLIIDTRNVLNKICKDTTKIYKA